MVKKHDIVLCIIIAVLAVVIVCAGIIVVNYIRASDIRLSALTGTIDDMQKGYSQLAGTVNNIKQDNQRLEDGIAGLVKASLGIGSGIEDADRSLDNAIQTAERIRCSADKIKN